jgi:hypothetical protein
VQDQFGSPHGRGDSLRPNSHQEFAGDSLVKAKTGKVNATSHAMVDISAFAAVAWDVPLASAIHDAQHATAAATTKHSS